ncbi:MAG: hypothetical protein IJT44_03580 [Clostridia bacterium]|nr:hypothetical protein [Clostridia bacterium]
MQIFDILLDMQATGCQQTVGLYQGENRLRMLCVTLLDHGKACPVPSDYSAHLRGTKPDGTTIVHTCGIRGGQIFYLPGAQTTAAAGTVHCQICIYGANGALLATPEFDIEVAPCVDAQELPESTDENNALDMQALSALSLSEDGLSLLLNGEPVSKEVRVVQSLPEDGRENEIVYLESDGFFRCTDGAWARLTDDALAAAVASLSDDVPSAADTARWDGAAADAHTHENKTALDTVTAAKTASWDAAATDAHTHANMTALDTIAAAKLASWDAAAADAHTHANQAALDSITSSRITAWETSGGIEVVETKPSPATVGKIICCGDFLWLGKQTTGGTEWLKIASHRHTNSTTLGKITEQNGQMRFDGRTVVTQTPDDVQPLVFAVYNSLSLRDDYTGVGSLDDVPIFVTDSAFTVGLYEDAQNPDTCDSVVLTEATDDDGLPVRLIKVRMNGVYAARWSRACTVLGIDFDAGVWYSGNTQTTAPAISDFYPHFLNVCGDWYDDLSALPAKAASALRSFSQCVNISAAAMGTIAVPDDTVTRLTGTIEPNRKYAYSAGLDLALPLPTVPWRTQDAQFVLYLTCTADVDVTFPQTTQFIGGVPNTETGVHKLIGSWLREQSCWAVGGLTAEAAS